MAAPVPSARHPSMLACEAGGDLRTELLFGAIWVFIRPTQLSRDKMTQVLSKACTY